MAVALINGELLVHRLSKNLQNHNLCIGFVPNLMERFIQKTNTMKKLLYTILAILCIISLAAFNYSSNKTTSINQTESSYSPLEGTWKLVKTKWGNMKAHETPKREIYKIFAKEHFFFIYYDSTNVSGAGGGTYISTEDSFTETLSYYSWDHSASGTQQTFNYTIQGDQLHQFGKIQNTDKYNDYVIDEFYERVEPGISSNAANQLLGVWEYTTGTGNTSEYIAENNIKALKVITPKHWHVIFTSQSNGEYHGVGFGTYSLDGNNYSERINAFSFDSTAVGKTFDFTIELNDDQWTQTGKINSDKYQNFTVKEVFKRVE